MNRFEGCLLPLLVAFLAGCGAAEVPPVVLPDGAASLQDGNGARDRWASEWGRVHSAEEFFLAPGAAVTRPVRLDGGCSVFSLVVLGGLRDADLGAWSAEGQRLAVDEAPDAMPTVQLCGLQGTVYLRASAYDGASLVSLRRYETDEPASLEGLGEGPATYVAGRDDAADLELGAAGFLFLREWSLVAEDAPPEVRATQIALPADEGCYTLRVLEGAASLRIQVQEPAFHAEDVGVQAAVQWCVRSGASAFVESDQDVRLRLYRADWRRVGGPQGLWLGARRAGTAD